MDSRQLLPCSTVTRLCLRDAVGPIPSPDSQRYWSQDDLLVHEGSLASRQRISGTLPHKRKKEQVSIMHRHIVGGPPSIFGKDKVTDGGPPSDQSDLCTWWPCFYFKQKPRSSRMGPAAGGSPHADSGFSNLRTPRSPRWRKPWPLPQLWPSWRSKCPPGPQPTKPYRKHRLLSLYFTLRAESGVNCSLYPVVFKCF